MGVNSRFGYFHSEVLAFSVLGSNDARARGRDGKSEWLVDVRVSGARG